MSLPLNSDERKMHKLRMTGAHLINEVECNCTLCNLHLFALLVLSVILSDLADTFVPFPRSFIFHPVFLCLQLGRSIEHYVLGITLRVPMP